MYRSGPLLASCVAGLVNDSFVAGDGRLLGLHRCGSSGGILTSFVTVGHRGGRHFTGVIGGEGKVSVGPSSVFSIRIGELRRCGERDLGVLGVVTRCRVLGTGPGTSFIPEACVFTSGTTPNCFVTGGAVRLVSTVSGIVGGSGSIGSGLGIIFVRRCGIDLTRILVPTTSFSRRVSLTNARTSNANGVGLVLGNTMALNALSNTGIRVTGTMNSSGVVVFNLGAPRIRRLGRHNCRPVSCVGGGHILGSIVSFVGTNVSNGAFNRFASDLVGISPCVTLTSFTSCRGTRRLSTRVCGSGRHFTGVSLVGVDNTKVFDTSETVARCTRGV